MQQWGFVRSARAALRGIAFAFSREKNLRIESIIAVIVLVIMLYLPTVLWQWVSVIFIITMVLAAELVNTAFERIVDILKPQKHPYARVIKDIAAGMVLVVACGALIGGCVIAWPWLVQIL